VEAAGANLCVLKTRKSLIPRKDKTDKRDTPLKRRCYLTCGLTVVTKRLIAVVATRDLSAHVFILHFSFGAILSRQGVSLKELVLASTDPSDAGDRVVPRVSSVLRFISSSRLSNHTTPYSKRCIREMTLSRLLRKIRVTDYFKSRNSMPREHRLSTRTIGTLLIVRSGLL